MSTPPGSDAPIPLSRFRAHLARPRGRRKLEALLAAEDPAAAVAALSATELYQTVAEVGLAEAGELVQLATAEQIRGCLDIEVWDRDGLQIEAVTPWLAALVEAGPDKLAEVWEQLDGEFAALTLQRLTRVYDLTQDEEPDEPEERAIARTPDTFFAVALPDDEATAALVHRVIEYLYRADPSGTLARHTLMAARTEPPAELEEMSYRWRAGRMADLGYADFYEALEVFRPLDPQRVRIGEGTADRFPAAGEDDDERASQAGLMPGAVAEGVVGSRFLSAALDAIDDPDELKRLETALLVLVNKVLAAARVSPGDAEALAAGARHAAATCALGLEALSQGEVGRAVEALRSVSLTRLHRLGHTLTLRMARMARALAPRAATASGPDAAMLAALLGRRPWFPTVLDPPERAAAGGDDAQRGAEIRPFESLDDLRRVAEALTRLALRVAVVDALGVDLLALAARPEPRPELDAHVRTALVRAASGRPLEAAPLAPEDALRFVRTALRAGRLTPEAREAATAALLDTLDRAEVNAGRQFVPELLAGWLDDLEQQLGGLPHDAAPDPRLLSDLVWES